MKPSNITASSAALAGTGAGTACFRRARAMAALVDFEGDNFCFFCTAFLVGARSSSSLDEETEESEGGGRTFLDFFDAR